MILICTVLATTVSAIVVSLMQHVNEADRKRIDAFHDRLEAPIGSLPEDIEGAAPVAHGHRMSPFRVVGISVAFIGLMMLVITPWVAEGVQRYLNAGLGAGMLLLGILMERRSCAVARKAAAVALTKGIEA